MFSGQKVFIFPSLIIEGFLFDSSRNVERSISMFGDGISKELTRDVLFLYPVDFHDIRHDIVLAEGLEQTAKYLRDMGFLDGSYGRDDVIECVNRLNSEQVAYIMNRLREEGITDYRGKATIVLADKKGSGVIKAHAQSKIYQI